jgi:hypothetical protein
MEYQRANSQILGHTLILTLVLFLGIFLTACNTSKAQTYTSQDRKAVKLFEDAKEYYQKRELKKTEH